MNAPDSFPDSEAAPELPGILNVLSLSPACYPFLPGLETWQSSLGLYLIRLRAAVPVSPSETREQVVDLSEPPSTKGIGTSACIPVEIKTTMYRQCPIPGLGGSRGLPAPQHLSLAAHGDYSGSLFKWRFLSPTWWTPDHM